MILINVKKFITLLIIFTVAILYMLFWNNYLLQREKMANVVKSSITATMSEMSYVLSKNIKKPSDIRSNRAFLDRASANNNFIKDVVLVDDTEILMSTNPKIRTLPAMEEIYYHDHEETFYTLKHSKAFLGEVRYYEGSKLKKYTLLIFIDQAFIENYFHKDITNYILLFVLIPLVLLVFVYIIFHIYIVSPLESLRQYAYYQNHVPKTFKVRELEAIRSSMVQTFDRLEKERKELFTQSRTDSLSGLANRNYLNERLKHLIASAQRNGGEFALLFLDLDHFKNVNDSLGHEVGDELLRNISSVIQDTLRVNDIVARIGGDEFIIVLSDYKDEYELVEITQRIQKRLNQPWVIQTHPIQIASSIGIALYPKDGESAVSLMQHADIAMYHAKDSGRARYHFYTQELNQKIQDEIRLNKEMIAAVENDEFELYYQPKIDIKNNRIIGAEALIRWNHPTRGLVSPFVFIPLAEHNGFIVEIGKWILKSAFERSRQWQKQGIDIKLSINIAVKQLLDNNFITIITSLSETTHVDLKNIDFEVTEYLLFDNCDKNLNTLKKLKSMGISISLDDFGTGYSSLSYLKSFPIDNLKIDKSFIDDIESESGIIFYETIVKMAQALKLNIIAEGVETANQLDFLRSLECNEVQGYIYSKPLQANNFETYYETFSLNQTV